MRTWMNIAHKKRPIRRLVAGLINWALAEELDELREHDVTLYRFFDNAERSLNTWKVDHARLVKQHEDWKDECVKTEEHRRTHEGLTRDQNKAIERIADTIGAARGDR